MTSHRTPQELRTAPLGALALAVLMLGSLAQGAESDQPKEQAANAVNPLPTGENAVKGTTRELPRAPAGKTPPREFVPSVDDPEGQIKAVDFPKDI